MALKTIFLDRDGVINKEVEYLHEINKFIFIDGVFETCLYFQKLGFRLIIVTNQSGIGRGYYTERDYQILTKWMLKKFLSNKIDILDIFHCPHSPEFNCNCRKPKPGMFIEAKEKHNISMQDSWMIGDKEEDIKAAKKAGIKNTILLRSGHKVDETRSAAQFIFNSIINTKKIIH
jgi:D-glycero-D-manno-heptose 1,7-bisphosphate phosphatase